jgi:hypothetical protein
MIAVIGMGGLYAPVGGLWFGPTGMIVSIIAAMVIMTAFLYKNAKAEKDPWAISDRTCLKCAKVEFNLTKKDEKDALKQEIRVAKNARRRELADAAEEAFEKKAKLRRMARA